MVETMKPLFQPLEESHRQLYHYTAPKRPEIRRHGTIACDIVEATPIVFHDTLYRFEYFRRGEQNEANPEVDSHFHFINVRTNEESAHFGTGLHFGAAFTDGDVMYVTGVRNGLAEDGKTAEDRIVFFRSKDLTQWEEYAALPIPDGMHAFNTGICRKDGGYTLLIEVDKPVGFTFRFARSSDMTNWTLLPEEYHFQDTPIYAGGPAIYSVPDDPDYYVLFLEAYPHHCFANCIAKSPDLIHWTYSPINPVLMYNEAEDKRIANPFLTPHEQERIARAWDINNSDMELCEFNGRTIIYYSWGSQLGIEFLAEASYEGGMKEFLQSYFDK